MRSRRTEWNTSRGHIVDKDGLHPVPSKVKAITEAPAPTNVNELRSYLGMVQYHAKFLPNLATELSPLHQLLKDKTPWSWTSECRAAFQTTKKLLTSARVLTHYDSSRPLRLPPWSRLLAPGLFKPSCSSPFTLFLLISFGLPALSTIFHSKNSLHNTSVFSSLLTAYFYQTGHSPVFIYNTALLYIVLLALCGHLQTQRVCRALHPVSGEDGILVAEVPRGVQHASSARTSPRRVVGLARPNQSAGRALP